MALMPDRPCWQCSHCSTMICPDPAADGLRVVGDARHSCPVCRQALIGAVMDDRTTVELCERCKGLLMARRAFSETLVARRRAADTPSVTPAPADRAQLQRRIACPNCAAPMIADWYYGPGNIVIDTCPACDIVWLDAGELRRAIDAPGVDRRR